MLSNFDFNVLLGAVNGGIVALISFVCLAVGGLIGYLIYRFYNLKMVGNTKIQANKIMDDARSEAKTLKKEASLEAKEELIGLRNEFERESKERRNEISKIETRTLQKEENISRKESNLDKKIENVDNQKRNLENKAKEMEAKEKEISNAHNKMIEELEKISTLTKEDAKSILVDEMVEEAKKDACVMARDIENHAKDEADKKAKNIISLAIQKCAVDHASEQTVSVVALPNDEMKGRLIGRVGRNIRALESCTGIDLIIDDTPDLVTLSGFDPIRREVARITIERLITDGRIHPSRIEEVVEKVRREMDGKIKENGELAAQEMNIYNLHPEIIKLLGRLKYRTSYGQNVLNHSLEVAHLAGIMAGELGLDPKIAKRAGLLHDIGKAVDHEVEGTHIQIGVDLCKKYKETKEVIHAVAAHHNDIEPTTIEAIVVQAADAISGARPGARRESLENYVKRLEKLEEIANSFAGVDYSYAIQAGREIRVGVKSKEITDEQSYYMARDIAKKLEEELEYPGQIKVNLVRESRYIEYAK